jgi:hypothetical protein
VCRARRGRPAAQQRLVGLADRVDGAVDDVDGDLCGRKHALWHRVEVPLGVVEHLDEGGAVVLADGRDDLLEAVVVAGHLEMHSPAVRQRVVRPAHRQRLVVGRRGDRRAAGRVEHVGRLVADLEEPEHGELCGSCRGRDRSRHRAGGVGR